MFNFWVGRYVEENWISLNLLKILYVFLTSDLTKAVRGQKHPLEAKNDMKELIY